MIPILDLCISSQVFIVCKWKEISLCFDLNFVEKTENKDTKLIETHKM